MEGLGLGQSRFIYYREIRRYLVCLFYVLFCVFKNYFQGQNGVSYGFYEFVRGYVYCVEGNGDLFLKQRKIIYWFYYYIKMIFLGNVVKVG